MSTGSTIAPLLFRPDRGLALRLRVILAQRAHKLRQALSIAVDMEEFLSIFYNGRGIVAQGPM
ncbi:hypothetical protein, partial [Candidatus Deferrimicrobium sp.]|uniref:hypothetical protein n=1 Tax=Candidatus Deferrimicrobium sp. TaxID=3060586 RepID=UPI002ED44B47